MLKLGELSKTQAKLDSHIAKEKKIDHEDYLLEKAISLCVELGELLNERPFIFKYWSNKTGEREKALTEYVDILHFILSLGNAIGFDFSEYKYKQPKVIDQRVLILGLFSMFSSIPHVKQFKNALTYFINLGEVLNFNDEEITEAYYEKVKVNHKRQEMSY